MKSLPAAAIFSIAALWVISASAQERLEVVELAGSSMESITEAGEASFRIANLTDGEINVTDIQLRIPASWGERRITCTPPAIDLNARESRLLRCEIAKIQLSEEPSLLFHRHRVRQARLELQYNAGGPQDSYRAPASLEPVAPLLGVLIGGLFGVIIILLLRELLRKKAPVAVDTGGASFWTSAATGALTVTLAILVFRYTNTKHPELPIAIQARDLIGGFFVGVLFEPITTWIAKLFGLFPAPPKDPTPATNASAPGGAAPNAPK